MTVDMAQDKLIPSLNRLGAGVAIVVMKRRQQCFTWPAENHMHILIGEAVKIGQELLPKLPKCAMQNHGIHKVGPVNFYSIFVINIMIGQVVC